MKRRRLKVDMDAILDSMTISGDAIAGHVLNLETGEVEMLMEDDDFDEDLDEDEDAGPGGDTPAADGDLEGPGHEPLPQFGGHQEYNLMASFAQSLDEDDVRDQLAVALEGKGAFRRFRDVVFRHRDLRDRWLALRQEKLLEIALDWFESIDVEPIYELRRPQPASPPPAPKGPGIGLIDLLLLGGPGGKTERIHGRVLRQFVATSPQLARSVFRHVARELCEFHGVAWRKRFVEDRNDYEIERARLEVEGNVVSLQIDVPAPIWEAFSRP